MPNHLLSTFSPAFVTQGFGQITGEQNQEVLIEVKIKTMWQPFHTPKQQ